MSIHTLILSMPYTQSLKLFSMQSTYKSLRTGLARTIILTLTVSLLAGVWQPTKTHAAAVASETPNSDFWVTDGDVEALAVGADGTVYIGGDFDNVGFGSGPLAAVDLVTGVATTDAAPYIQGATDLVDVVISDGDGGYFVGGKFTLVDTTTVGGLIHVRADGTLDTDWLPAMSGGGAQIYDLWLDDANDTLYVAGSFTALGGQSRDNLGAVSTVTGLATDFNPDTNGIVTALASADDILYAGGLFTTLNAGGVTRNRLAAFDLTSETISVPTDFDPNVANTIYDILVHDGSVFATGQFTTVNGATTRNRLAAFDPATALATDFNPNVANGVGYAIATIGDTLFVGGSFTSAGGSGRNRLAAFDLASGTPNTATSFNPNMGSAVYSLGTNGNILYAGGAFLTVNGATSRIRVASFDTSVGHTATAFDPRANSNVDALFVVGDNLIVGGQFEMVNNQARRNFAAFDGTTGEATALDPSPNFLVYDMALDAENNLLYVGGSFTNFGGVAKSRVGAIDLDTDTVTAFNPAPNTTVLALAVHDGDLYMAGQFTTIASGATTRANLAAVDSAGAALDFDPDPDDLPRTLFVEGDILYVGGEFATFADGATARNRAASFDLASVTPDVATAFDPNAAGGDIYAIAHYDDTIYLGGGFTTMGGQARNKLAAVDATTGVVSTIFTAGVSGSVTSVHALHTDDNILYVGGSFTSAGGVSSSDLVAFKLTATNPSTALSNFDVDIAGNGVFALATTDESQLYVGGDFSQVLGTTGRAGFVRFERGNRDPDLPTNLRVSGTEEDATTNTTPELSFVTSDPDEDPEVKYYLEVDDTADFSSPLIAYTSALGTPGESVFQIGQPAGTGTYIAGGEGASLGRGSYYWRVKAIDQHDDESGYAVANGGSEAIIINNKSGFVPESAGGGGAAGVRTGIEINNGDRVTDSATVELSLGYNPGIVYMQVFNNPTATLPRRERVDSTKSWTICEPDTNPCLDGDTYEVSARFFNLRGIQIGNTVTDSIIYSSQGGSAVLGETTEQVLGEIFESFTNPFQYSWLGQSGTVENGAHVIHAQAGQTIDLNLRLSNRATDAKALVLYGLRDLLPQSAPYRGGHELRIGTGNPRDKIYDWIDASSFLPNPDGKANRFAIFNGEPVHPQQEFGITWPITLRDDLAPGSYDLFVELVREFDAWAIQVDRVGRPLPSSDIFWRIVVS